MNKNVFFLVFPMSWVKKGLMNLPAHMNLSYFWNFGSFLGIILGVQILSGVFLSMKFVGEGSLAFYSVISLTRESLFGFVLRWVHLNGATFFFFLIYLHIFRGLFYKSYRLMMPWVSGVSILIILMATAFLGYVLPWGQMSLWGATVITNLLSTVPVFGFVLVCWIWGGWSVGSPTLGVFYSLHFVLPFVILVLVVFHMLFLHESGSSSSLSLFSGESKMKFSMSFLIKDMMNFVILGFFFLIVFWGPFFLGDPENFSEANFLSSPLHIQPEWYFLFVYAILRSIPSKLGGVIALVGSVLVLYFLPFFSKVVQILSKLGVFLVFVFFFVCLVLTWVGGNPVEAPYVLVGQGFTFFYFFLVLILCF